MSYKKGLEQFKEIQLEAIKNGKNAVLLAQNNYFSYYAVSENIAHFRRIICQDEETGITSIELEFANGKIITTRAYLDKTITPGSFVSTIGYFTDSCQGMSYFCKGGINAIITNAKEFEYFSTSKIYKMGLVINLSKAEESKRYTSDNEIKPLGQTGFYYILESNSPLKDLKIPTSSINISAVKDVIRTADYSSDVEDEEDYPDIPENDTAKDNNAQ